MLLLLAQGRQDLLDLLGLRLGEPVEPAVELLDRLVQGRATGALIPSDLADRPRLRLAGLSQFGGDSFELRANLALPLGRASFDGLEPFVDPVRRDRNEGGQADVGQAAPLVPPELLATS